MPNFHALKLSRTTLILEDDPLAAPTPSASVLSSQAPIIVDDTPLSPLGMVVIKIYAFGGLVFVFSVIAAAIAYWVWVVIIKLEFSDSPPELDVHPERMGEREKARIARIKKKREEKMANRKRREAKKFTVPPLQYDQKKGRDLLPEKPPMRNPSVSSDFSPQKSSGLGPSKRKRVSFASSTSTLDGSGNLTKRPLDDGSEPVAIKQTTVSSREDIISAVPRAYPSLPFRSVSIEERSRRGRELIAAMNPDVAMSWARPDNQLKS